MATILTHPPQRSPPLPADKLRRLASLDGDADRLVYHYYDASGNWHLLDGDKIAALCGVFFAEQLQAAGLTMDPEREGDANYVAVAAVQTAYANGASHKYIQETLSLPAPLTKTGVRPRARALSAVAVRATHTPLTCPHFNRSSSCTTRL